MSGIHRHGPSLRTVISTMAKRMTKVHRLFTLFRILSSGRILNTLELAQLCGVSRRTVFRDIRELRKAGMSIEYDPQQDGMQLSDESIESSSGLTRNQVLAILVSCEAIGHPKSGLPYQNAAGSAGRALQHKALTVNGLDEIAPWVLSLGSHAVVMKP